MLNITDVAQEQKIPAFFRLGFRPFFLSSVLFSILAITVWILFLTFHVDFTPFGGTFWWHAHEMLFGFVVPIVVGFLLTAVQTWTGIPGVRGTKLAILFLMWLLARILLLATPSFIPLLLITILDVAFLPLSAIMLASSILRVKQWRNLFFVPVLVLLAAMNILYHLQVIPLIDYANAMQHGSYGAIMLITLIMVVMGGRVIPFFTANATKIVKQPVIVPLEFVCLGSTWLIALVYVLGINQLSNSSYLIGFLSLIAGVSNLIRCARWHIGAALPTPLLWSLHLAYWFIPVSFILLSAHLLLGWFSFSNVLHGFTVGAMANLILAMISRVSLGHTGRILQVNAAIKWAFMLMALAACSRVFLVMIVPQYSILLWWISATLWCGAFGIFTWAYWPILTQPRVDGRPG
ncbi:NnrS family protein [Thalassotalea marina]|uniref:Heme transporter CcmB n=1 Tax=Thalassotalea marina TaxID=1673741 RepID=A0A919BJH1_9GAMM|nr:NnrS family protein [Thalassotalea marina]GHF91926.1 heme transporter CcmB [Thalassotalea marina]